MSTGIVLAFPCDNPDPVARAFAHTTQEVGPLMPITQ